MNKITKAAIVLVLILAIGAVVALKERNKDNSESKIPEYPVEKVPAEATSIIETDKVKKSKALPRLVDVGAGTCIPCKLMAPILEQLKSEYAGRLKVEFFDVREDPNVITEYKVMIIPTQIFFDASGKERFRHEGFFSKEDILAKWKELGANLTKPK